MIMTKHKLFSWQIHKIYILGFQFPSQTHLPLQSSSTWRQEDKQSREGLGAREVSGAATSALFHLFSVPGGKWEWTLHYNWSKLFKRAILPSAVEVDKNYGYSNIKLDLRTFNWECAPPYLSVKMCGCYAKYIRDGRSVMIMLMTLALLPKKSGPSAPFAWCLALKHLGFHH